jgi:tetratricopeptide (TPR) repeat protein
MKFLLAFVTVVLFLDNGYAQKISKAESHFNDAVAETDKGDYHKAIAHFQKAIKEDPSGRCGSKEKGRAQAELGYAYFRSGDSLNAIVYYNKAIELNKTNPYPRLNKAALLLMQRNTKGALKELDALIALNPTHVNAYVQRGFLHHSENNVELSRRDLNKALSLDSAQHVLPPPLIKTIEQRLQSMAGAKPN